MRLNYTQLGSCLSILVGRIEMLTSSFVVLAAMIESLTAPRLS